MKLQNKEIEVKVDVRGLQITGRPITASKLDEIQNKHTTIKGRSDERRVVTDRLGISKDTWCYMIKDWGDATDADGKKLQCNDRNKLDVFEFDSEFVNEAISAINEAVRLRREEAGKN